MSEIRFMTLDPAHFHAALLQKEMYADVSPHVSIYAPVGLDLADHLARVARFNVRAQNPTAWTLDIHAGPEFLERMLRERPGNVVVLSGRNQAKMERIHRSVAAGLHVLADKPWTLDARDLPLMEESLDLAGRNGSIAYDIMTERYETTSIVARELVNTPAVFGAIERGSRNHPAVSMESVHRLLKLVAGAPNLRPAWFFDVEQQGEALADVGTHLVDLAQWTVFPGQALDSTKDIELLDARRWPTILTREQWTRVTAEPDFPERQASCVKLDMFHYFCNNFLAYTLRGVHVQLNVLWDFAGPPPNDTYAATFRGTRASVEVRQGEAENFRAEVYVVPDSASMKAQVLAALREKAVTLQGTFAGLSVDDRGSELRVHIPDRHRSGHEAHFAQVTRQFFEYVKNPGLLPAWENPGMLAKYYVSTKGVELARRLAGEAETAAREGR
jgi:predicted dehydrogenase